MFCSFDHTISHDMSDGPRISLPKIQDAVLRNPKTPQVANILNIVRRKDRNHSPMRCIASFKLSVKCFGVWIYKVLDMHGCRQGLGIESIYIEYSLSTNYQVLIDTRSTKPKP